MNIVWPGGKIDVPRFRGVCRTHVDEILAGRLIAIDPATNNCGWALFEAAEHKDGGTIKMNPGKPLNQRLADLYDHLQELHTPDVLVVESVRGSRLSQAVKYSAGVAMAGVRAPVAIECPIPCWKAVAACVEGYVKTDENDAWCIGMAAIEMARDVKFLGS